MARYTATLVACGWAEAVLEEITRDREFGLFITTKRAYKGVVVKVVDFGSF